MPGHLSEDQRLAGLDAHAGEMELCARAGQSRLDQVEFACRNAPGDEQQVSFRGLGKRSVESPRIV